MQLHENELFTIDENTYKIIDGKPELQSKEEIKMDAKTRFMGIWCRLHAQYNSKYPGSMFYVDENDRCYFELETSGTLACSYEKVWKVFEDEYHLEYKEIQALIKTVLEEELKTQGITPIWHFFKLTWQLEDRFKLKKQLI